MGSIGLVERLLSDLLKTSEGYQKLKRMAIESNSKQTTNDNRLKEELTKLRKWNDELHLELMKQKEKNEEDRSRNELEIKK